MNDAVTEVMDNAVDVYKRQLVEFMKKFEAENLK